MALSLSSYRDSDLHAFLELWNEGLPLDAMTVEYFSSRILLDENFDPETLLIAREGKDLVGCVLGFHAKRLPMGDADPDGTRGWCLGLGVRPGSDRNSVTKELLKGLEQKLRKLRKVECVFCTYPAAYITPGVDIRRYAYLVDQLQSEGYREIKQALSMDASIALFEISQAIRESQERLAADGIEFRTYREDDLIRFLDFLEGSMPTDWVRVERRNLRLIPSGLFRPEQITIVTSDKEIIGYCQFEGSHFGPFGVADRYQGKGIGTVLLARTLERMRTMGLHNAWVMWTDDIAAKVYQKFGFTETRRFSILQKSL